MSQPRLEHLAVAADRPLEQATGRRPPLPIGLWLPPAAAVFGVLAATLALCLSGPQAPAAATPGWRDPHQAPLLIAWLGTLAAVFLAPPLSAADDPNAPRLRFWQRALQAGALGLPITAVVWTFHSIALLLDTTAAVRIPPAALGWSRHLPDGLIAALAVGASAAGAWLWARRWPRAGVVLLTAWAALPPL
ncbi:MAG: hypothetical protein ACREJ2_00255, partial [Planctomycetota bacterium]